ncbi:hypothetical protein ACJMK2_042277 [Sinanodonta woodiana]|uniref:Phosphatidic acid phosphatase type 2/haloperoxidase domain-containing protein n=1 Tax=Sinanodonta woodiana TaxID=1069815 RepID=A0ABD3W7V2_SINWO
MYTSETEGGSVENLQVKEGKDDLTEISDDYRPGERGKILVCVTFVLELLILAAVIVLEYFLRWSTLFPVRKQNFSCVDPELSYSKDDPSFSTFAFSNSVPDDTIYALTFCVPPFVIIVGEIGVWSFSDEEQKAINIGCRACAIPQVVRRLFRFIAVFFFGAFTLMIFVDLIKLVIGRLRPNFLEICEVNKTMCAANSNIGGDEMCLTDDELTLRDARTSFPSMFCAITAYSAIFIAIYIHGALRTRSVRVLRPFLALAFCMLSLLSGLSELASHRSFWTDVVVGFAMGITMAIYLGSFVLYHFREYVSERKLIRMLHGFMMDHQLLNEITKDGKLRLFPFPFHIPRAHTGPRQSYHRFDGIKPHSPPLEIYRDLANDPYRDRNGTGTSVNQEQGISHL